MITAKEIKEFLDTPIYMTRAEIIELMDEEIDKGPEDMDTDLVDHLVELLLKLDEEEEKMAGEPVELPNPEIIEIPEQSESDDDKDNDKKDDQDNPKIITFGHRLKFKKIAAVAAAACIITATAMGASAHFFDFNIAEELVEYFSNHLKIKMEGGSQNADSYSLAGSSLACELEANGISPVTLPATLLTDEWIIKSISSQKDDILATAEVKFKKEDISATMTIIQYASKDFMPQTDVMYPKKGTQVDINGMNVLVVASGESIYVYYQDNLTEYNFTFNTDFESVIEIVNSIS